MEFSKIYNRDEFLNFLRRDFLPDDFTLADELIEFATKTTYSKQATKLGVCKSLDLVVYEIKHSGKDDPRVGLSKEAFRMLSEEWQSRALVLFVPESNANNYRFSLIEIKLEGDETSAKVHRKYSNPHRYSYLLGEGVGGHTPKEYLLNKGKIRERKEGNKNLSSWEDLLSRFSVEILTKAFYAELSDWYAWAIDTVTFPGEQTIDDKDKRNEHRSKNVIRLLTRLLFVWFLKQKKLIPDELFDEAYLKNNILKDFAPNLQTGLFKDKSKDSVYYKAILQNLFFATLNCPIIPQSAEDKRERGFRKNDWYGQSFGYDYLMRYESLFSDPAKFLEIVNECVPFLNGGLFDCLDDKQNKIYIDGFSDNLPKPSQLIVPDYLFFGEVGKGQDLSDFYGDKKKKSTDVYVLLDILKKYNFTIEENTPFDQDVSLDPELLGKVFENLLASYNPETKTTARKQTGSFYTPREIVQYMVDESLVAHLKRTVGEDLENEYRKLMRYTDEPTTLNDEQQCKIIQSLQNCKVLDPACGSGAFPVGVLQQMVHILSQIDPKNETWKNLILENSIRELSTTLKDCTPEERDEIQADINRNFDDSINRPDYARKLYLIENCIYGVDIQPIAIQISKLRFFISLVVDQKPTTDANTNFGIRPLPNLEAKFAAANTIIGLNKGERNLFDNQEVEKLQEKLIQASHRIFGAKSNKRKNKYKADVEELQNEIAAKLLESGDVGNDDARLMREWRMFDQNASSPFFDPEWMFGVSGGFDIVIGNPPYVQLQANGGELARPLTDMGYETFARTGDIYCIFYERGWQVLNDGGHLCFITSNKWMRAGYGEKIRGFFAQKTNPKLLIDFAGVKVFESATVDTNILLFSKSKNLHHTVCAVTNKADKNSLNNLSVFVQQEQTVCDFASSDSWVILSSIEQSIKRKIEAVGTPLKDWDIKINYGIKTGYNEAFIIDTTKRDEILANCADEDERKRTEELIRPILRGRDIKRYGYEWANLYLIATFPSRHYDIEEYSAVKNYLLSFGIERLEQTGKEYIVNGEHIKARKKTNNKWFETQDSISYWEDFDKPKIVYMEIQTDNPSTGYPFPCYSYDNGQSIVLNTGYVMSSRAIDVRYILGILNSILGKFLVKLYVTQLQERQFRMLSQYVANFPIAKATEQERNSIIQLVGSILAQPNEEKEKEKEKEIASLAFKIYGFTDLEIKSIQSQQSQ